MTLNEDGRRIDDYTKQKIIITIIIIIIIIGSIISIIYGVLLLEAGRDISSIAFLIPCLYLLPLFFKILIKIYYLFMCKKIRRFPRCEPNIKKT